MVLLGKLWDDVVAGPQPERGLGRLRKLTTNIKDEGEGSKYQRTMSMPATPATPVTTPTTPMSVRKVDNVWRSVFRPGSNSATRTIGAEMFDKPLPNSSTVYDCCWKQSKTRPKGERREKRKKKEKRKRKRRRTKLEK